jgi:hypothetical protein
MSLTKISLWWTLKDCPSGSQETTSVNPSVSVASNISWSFHGNGTAGLTSLFPTSSSLSVSITTCCCLWTSPLLIPLNKSSMVLVCKENISLFNRLWTSDRLDIGKRLESSMVDGRNREPNRDLLGEMWQQRRGIWKVGHIEFDRD